MIKVLIDPGHGGGDPGAYLGNRREKDDVLTFSRLLQAEINKYQGVEAYLTRSKDVSTSLEDRASMQRFGKYDYFISIHRNANAGTPGTGVETFVWLNPIRVEQQIAACLQDACVSCGFVDRGVKRADFYVLRETNCSAFLCELGFINNSRDNSLFDVQKAKMAERMAAGFCGYLGLKKPSATMVFHTVVRGDTLYSLSKRYGTSVNAIVDLNRLADRNKIIIGQKLRIK